MKRTQTSEAVLRLLAADPERLEAGLVVLDTRLSLGDDVLVDMLARDNLGYPVVVLLGDSGGAAAVGRMATIVPALHQGRHLLQRLYGDKGLDPSLRPRFVLLNQRFSDQVPGLLDVLTSLEVRALEYRIVLGPDDAAVLDLQPFHRTGGLAARSSAAARGEPPREPSGARASAGATRAGGPASADRSRGTAALNGRVPGSREELLPEVDAPDAAKRLFLRARESICSLSGQVSERGEGGRMTYHVDEGLLATITLDEGGFRVQIGDEPAALHEVQDDGSFNESLNAIFNLYFDRYAAHS